MGEVVNVIVAFAFIVFLLRWVTSTSSNDSGTGTAGERSPAQTLGFRPKNVTQDMVDVIHNMFPDIPKDNIHYDLLRTGNVELTSNKILEKGFLEAPPEAYYTIFPRPSSAGTTTADGSTPSTSRSSGTSLSSKQENLISRYNLHDRLTTATTPKAPLSSSSSSPSPPPPSSSSPTSPSVSGGIGQAAVWEDSPEKREASLRERKAQMILAARQRLLEQQRPNASKS